MHVFFIYLWPLPKHAEIDKKKPGWLSQVLHTHKYKPAKTGIKVNLSIYALTTLPNNHANNAALNWI